MTADQKAINRYRFRVAAFVFLTACLVMAFVLAWVGKDVTAFGIVTGTLSAPMAALLIADYATTPKAS